MLLLKCLIILFMMILIKSISSSTSTVSIESTTIQSILGELLKLKEDLKKEMEQLKINRKKFEEMTKQMQKSIENRDVIRLNVGGEIIMTTRETLIRVPKSILSTMFNGRWEQNLQTDQNGNIFLDFNPILFRHLLDQLQIFDRDKPITFSPPADPSLVESFKKMLRKLNLHQFLSLDKTIITFNIGGQIITNQRTTFTQVSNSSLDTLISSSQTTKLDNKSDVFVDSNPKFFQHLINQLRKKPSESLIYFNAPSYKEKISFKRMLNDLSIYRQALSSTSISFNTKWKQNGINIAGGNGNGNQLHQLFYPRGICIDGDNDTIYIADSWNNRIVQLKIDASNGQVVAGGNGKGDGINQLDQPSDVIVDKINDFIIICDRGNSRVVQLSHGNRTNQQTIISNIACSHLTMDNNGDLYISDYKKHEVRRWIKGDTNGTIVAGGNGQGAHLNQLSSPTYIFVDQDYSVYVSDSSNQRVMKWMKGEKEGTIVAGGHGLGNSLAQLSGPNGVIVDQLGRIYVADTGNDRIIRWSKGSREGSIVIGENEEAEEQTIQLNGPQGLSFDEQGNLYVVDHKNHRVKKFDVDID